MVDTNNITAQQALDHALQATALQKLSVPPLEVLNSAGQHLVSMYAWRWLTTDQAWLNVRGNVSLTDGTWTESTKRLTSSGGTPFDGYEFLPGDYFEVTSGTGVIKKRIDVASAGSSSQIVLDESLSSSGGDLATGDIQGTLHLPRVALPDDFGSLVSLEGADTLAYGVTMTSPSEIQRLRTNHVDVDTGWHFRAAVLWVGTPARPVLDIYPDHTSDTEDQFSLVYKRGWKRLADTEQTLMLPDFCNALYYQLVRAFALGYERHEDFDVDDRLAKIHVGPMFKAATDMDRRQQVYLGQMTGGAVARTSRPRYPNALSTEVGGPT